MPEYRWNRFSLDKELFELDDLLYTFFRETFHNIVWNACIYKDEKTNLYKVAIHLSYFNCPDTYINSILKYIKDNFDLDKDFVYEDEQACQVIQCKSINKDKLLAVGGMCRILKANKS